MTALPANAYQSFMPNDLDIPEDWSEAQLILVDYFRKIIDSLNDKEIAQYNLVEIVTGQKWFTPSNNQKERYVYRKVIDFGALPNAATKSVAHGITTTATTVFTNIYGASTDPGASAITASIPLPFSSPTLNENIKLNVDATNVNVTTGIDYTAYTETYIILEYIQAWS